MKVRINAWIIFKIILMLLLMSCTSSRFLKSIDKLTPKSEMDKALNRITETKANFAGATRAINDSRDCLFNIAATSEKKDQLKAKETELEQAQSDEDKERITIEIQEIKDEEIEDAHHSGRMEKLKLTGHQLKDISRIIMNLKIAIVLDKRIINDAPKIITDGTAAFKNAKPIEIMKVAKLKSAINELPNLINEAPKQIKTITAFLSTTSVLRNNNPVEDSELDAEVVSVQDLNFGEEGF